MTANQFDLSNNVAVVTGGNGGIGRGIALAFAAAGASVAIIGRNQDKNEAVLHELEALGAKACALAVDVTAYAELPAAIDSIEDQLGAVTVLVNNAGVGALGGILTLGLDDWNRVIDTNLTSAFMLSQLVGRRMVTRGAGKVINISSDSINYGWPRNAAYAVSKAALVHLTKCLAVEAAPFNVQVNAIVPGWVDTEMTQSIKSTPRYQQTVDLTPAGRWAQPEDIAGTAVFLASSASDFMTGAVLTIDGGLSLTYAVFPPSRELPDW